MPSARAYTPRASGSSDITPAPPAPIRQPSTLRRFLHNTLTSAPAAAGPSLSRLRPPLKSYDSVLVVDGFGSKVASGSGAGGHHGVRGAVRKALRKIGCGRKEREEEGPRVISGTQRRTKLKGREKQRDKMMMLGMGQVADNESAVGFDERDLNGEFYQMYMARRRDPARMLPPEITTQIFSYLDHRSLISSSAVSRSWNALATTPLVWRQVFHSEFSPSCKWKSFPGRDWQRMFMVNRNLRNRWRRAEMSYKYMEGHGDSVYCVQFDDTKAITGSRDLTIRIWDIKTGECTRVLHPADSPLFGSDTADFPTSPSSATSCPSNARHSGSILCLQYDSTTLITGSSDSTVLIYSLPTLQTTARLSNHTMGVLDVCFSDSHIVTCSRDMTICVYDRQTLSLLRRLEGHKGPVNAVQIRKSLLVSASGDATVKLWDLHTGACIRTFEGHQRGLACVQFSSDAKTIVSGGNDCDVRVWDAQTGECRMVLEGHKNLVRTLCLDDMNMRIVSGSYDATVKVWNLETGKLVLDIKHFHSTWILAVKADKRRLVSTSQDRMGLVIDFGEGVEGLEELDEEVVE